MEIIKTPTIGFCFGVKRAVEGLYGIIKTAKTPVYTYGELIHNDEITKKFHDLGVKTVNSAKDIPQYATVVIRAHGVPKNVIEILEEKKATIIDMTCPKVKKIHKIVANAENTIIVGNFDHPEVVGIAGNAKSQFFIAKDIDEFKKILHNIYNDKKNYTLVSQTTFLSSEWKKILSEAKKYPNIEIFSTICNSTETRQKEVYELSKKVDLFIIVGSPESSNTKKLHDIAAENCTTIYHGQLKELPNGTGKYERIGLSSGASSPERAVEEVFINMNNENDNKILGEEDVNFLDVIESSIRTIRNGQRIKGVVTAINGTEVQLDLGVKHAGFIPASEFENDEEPLKIGDEVDAFVVKVNDAEGTALLSKRNLDIAQGMEKIVKANEEGEIVKGKVHEVVKGGLVVIVNKIRVFVPASQATLRRDENLEELAGKETKLRIIEVDNDKGGKRRRIIGSIKSVLKEERQKAAEEVWANLAVGNKYEGVVKSLTSFGAFVDIGGVDGLVHVTEISWDRIVHPSQVVKVGDKVNVIVKDLNLETKKISLTMKSDENDPWKAFTDKISVGDIIDSVVLNIMPYGAFVSVSEGVDGLVHVSQIASRRVDNVSDVLTTGQAVRVKVIGIDNEARKVSLSIRDAESEEAEPEVESEVAFSDEE